MCRIVLVLTFLLGAVPALAQKLDTPKLVPTAINDSQKRLLEEGVRLHNKGEYDAALLKYAEVLSINPDSVEALYESAYTCFEKKDHKCSIEFSSRAAQYKSESLPHIYVQLGSAYDELGQRDKAVEVYKHGIKLFPGTYLLHYNLALTYRRIAKESEAREETKQSALLNPDHPSSQLMLAHIYMNAAYKTPALLAACRFLVMEPRSQRSAVALDIIRRVLDGNVSRGKNAKTINIFIDEKPSKTDEGDFGRVELFYPLLKAASMTEKNQNRTQAELTVESFSKILKLLDETPPRANDSRFPVRYYLPYYAEMSKRGYVEPFAYYILQSSGMPGVSEWLAQHHDKVSEFLTWSKKYSWPEP